MNRVFFFSGPPKAGKSITLHGLHKWAVKNNVRFFLERVHPDQEGNWTLETANGQSMARGLKNGLKERGAFWSPSFVQHACRSIAGLAKTMPLVLADMGGIPSPENSQIVASAKSAGAEVLAVVLHGAGTDPQEWVNFWRHQGIEPLVVATQFKTSGPEGFEAEKGRLVGELTNYL